MSSQPIDTATAFARLQALLGEEVHVHVQGAIDDALVGLVSMSGVLRSGWPDPHVAEEMEVGAVLPFHLDHERGSFMLDADAVAAAWVDDERQLVRVRLGDELEIVVWPDDEA